MIRKSDENSALEISGLEGKEMRSSWNRKGTKGGMKGQEGGSPKCRGIPRRGDCQYMIIILT